jgi:succinate dehydrogenase/fumarate reductase flavoprotein subunit
VGEAAGLQGCFGADRAGGAILACLVFGHRAGAAAGADVAGQGTAVQHEEEGMAAEAERYLDVMRRQASQGDLDPATMKTEIRRLSDACIGAIRSKEGLHKFLKEGVRLYGLTGRLTWKDPAAMIDAVEVSHMILTGCAVASSALERRESRGHHFREDMPKKNDAGELRWIVVRGENPEAFDIASTPVPFGRYPIKPPVWKDDR